MFVKPQRLKKGDTVAVLSPSAGLPSLFPHIYEEGLKNLQDLGLKIKEFPNPKARAEDLNKAFEDHEVKGIITSIGGDDSVRILPYLNLEIIKANPKLFMGYSDTTTMTSYLNQQGLVTFNGPSVMAGFSQLKALPDQFKRFIETFLFEKNDSYVYLPYGEYHDGYLEWKEVNNVGKVKEAKKATGWDWLQGTGTVEGELFGGCIEVLEMMKGTDFWPKKDFWSGKILFLETSEDKPTVEMVKYFLRNYGVQGVFARIKGLLFGRARDYTDEEKDQLDKMIVRVVAREFGQKDLMIVSNIDFGHTDPQIILPLGIKAELNSTEKTFKLRESPFAD